MFKKKKPLAGKHEDIKMTGAHQHQTPIDYKKIVKLSLAAEKKKKK